MDNSALTFVQKLSLGLYVLLIFLSMQGIMSFGTINLVVFGLWLILTVISFGFKFKSCLSSRRFKCLLIFLLFYFLSSCFASSVPTSINRCVAFLCVSSPIVMYEIVKDLNIRLKRFILLVTAAIVTINIILSFSFLDLVGANNLRGGNEEKLAEEYYIIGIVFNMCYAFAIVIPGVVEILRKYRTKLEAKLWIKCILFALVVVLLIYLIRAQFITAVILSVVGSLVAFFYRNKKSIVTVAVVLSVTSVAFISLYPKLSQSIDPIEYADTLLRLDEVYATLTGRSHDAADMNSRQEFTKMSMETFVNNPIFGVNHKLKSNIHVNLQGIGNHAEWPDSLARYGLFAVLLFIFLLDSLKRQRQETGAIFPTALFILLGFLNPMWFFPQMYATFMILPLLSDIVLDIK